MWCAPGPRTCGLGILRLAYGSLRLASRLSWASDGWLWLRKLMATYVHSVHVTFYNPYIRPMWCHCETHSLRETWSDDNSHKNSDRLWNSNFWTSLNFIISWALKNTVLTFFELLTYGFILKLTPKPYLVGLSFSHRQTTLPYTRLVWARVLWPKCGPLTKV